MKWHERLERLMREKGWSVAELSRRSGVPYDSVSKYVKGKVDKPRGTVLSQLGAALETTEQYLLYGDNTYSNYTLETDYGMPQDAMFAFVQETKRIPQLTMTELAKHQAGHNIISVWSGEMSTVVDDSVSADCIAVSVDDNSMAPEFSPGDVLVCDPNAAIEPGSYVIAVSEESDRALFRKYRLAKNGINGRTHIELKPLNDDYPTVMIDDDHHGHIIAKCIKVIKQL